MALDLGTPPPPVGHGTPCAIGRIAAARGEDDARDVLAAILARRDDGTWAWEARALSERLAAQTPPIYASDQVIRKHRSMTCANCRNADRA